MRRGNNHLFSVAVCVSWTIGYSLLARSPPFHLKTIMSLILRLTKKENSICVSITLQEVVMIAMKWLLSHRGGRDKEDERSAGAAPAHIIAVLVCVCVVGRWGEVTHWFGVGNLSSGRFSRVSQSDRCGFMYAVCFSHSLSLHAFIHITVSNCLLLLYTYTVCHFSQSRLLLPTLLCHAVSLILFCSFHIASFTLLLFSLSLFPCHSSSVCLHLA